MLEVSQQGVSGGDVACVANQVASLHGGRFIGISTGRFAGVRDRVAA